MIKIGIDVGGTTMKLGAVQEGIIIARDTRPSPREPEKMVAELGDMILSIRAKYPEAPVCISSAGETDAEGCLTANQLGFFHAPIGPGLQRLLHEKIPIENDALCALMAEKATGALVGCENAVMITLGTGVGGAVLTEGHPYRGRGGAHGDLGHMITHANGRLCSCGKRGCWEAYASATALSQMAGGMAPREIIERVKKGEMQELWAAYIEEVAQGLISTLAIFYPEKIIIGGGLSNAGEIVIGAIRERVQQDPSYQKHFQGLPIEAAKHRNDAGILGAAALA